MIDSLKKLINAQTRIIYGEGKVTDTGFYICNTLEILSVRIDGVDTPYLEVKKGGPLIPYAKQIKFADRDFEQMEVEYSGPINRELTATGP